MVDTATDSVIRTYRLNADSVEVTDTRAVAIGNHAAGTSGCWVIDVLDITQPLTLNRLDRYKWNEDPPVYQNDGAHDLVVVETAQGESWALVKTRKTNVVVQDLTTPPTSVPTTHQLSSSGDPLGDYAVGTGVFVSDSTAMAQPSPEGGQWKAVAIGTDNLATAKTAYVDFIDIGVSPPQMTTLAVLPQVNSKVSPSDVKVTWDGQRVVVRCAAPPSDPPPVPGGRDVLVFSVYPPLEVARFGASGRDPFAVDSLEVGLDRAISVTESRITGNTGDGWVHFIDL